MEIVLNIKEMRDAKSERVAKLRELSATHGLPVSSCVLGEHNNGGIATWWRDINETSDEVRLAINWCVSLGAETLLLPFFFSNEPKGFTHRAVVVERLKPLCVYAAEKNVVIAYEGVQSAEQLLEMAKQIDSPAFGVYYDPANATWCDYDAAAELRLLGKLVRQMHIKDAQVFTGDVPAGEGRVDWPAVAAALNAIEFDRWLALETPPASIEQDIAFARRTFPGLSKNA